MNERHQRLFDYVNAATDLADSLRLDVQDGAEISPETVRALSKFKACADEVQALLDMVEQLSTKNTLN